MEPQIKILEYNIMEEAIVLSIKATCKFNPQVKSPKVSIVFSNGHEERILPMVIEAVQTTKDLKGCIIYAKYTYFIQRLFLNYAPNDNIEIHFCMSYGNDYMEYIPFEFSKDVDLYNEVYQSEIGKDSRSLKIIRKEQVEEENEGHVVLKYIGGVLSTIYSAILFVFATLLLPLFFVDAIVTRMGLSAGSKQNLHTGIKWYLSHIRWRFCSFYKKNLGIGNWKIWYLEFTYKYYKNKPVVPNRVTFLSSRRSDMTGNLGFIYDAIKDREELDIKELLDPTSLPRMKLSNIRKLSYLCATSSVLLIDDFFPTLNRYELRKETKLIQLWHACGAFKTFGFSRLGKRGGPTQKSMNHRNYNYAIVSSKEIAKFYAEGFGIPLKNVVATGVPRTDVFFQQSYKKQMEEKFYSQYPKLRDKKIILFAPTFRGNGKESAYYPMNRFDPDTIFEMTNQEYAILIKHHPFVTDAVDIHDKYSDYIIDMSEQSELNDLLFVTDLVITDYSSLIFEASLLDIPMLFYAYDLNRYIATRDFYYEYELFVPGKIVQSQASLIEAINQQDFEQDKIGKFKTRFFDDLDGCSTKRVVELIDSILEQNR